MRRKAKAGAYKPGQFSGGVPANADVDGSEHTGTQ